jgi:hypothetical protein
MSDNWWLTARAGIPLFDHGIPVGGDWMYQYPEYSGYINISVEAAIKNIAYYWVGPGQPQGWRQIPFFTTSAMHSPNQLGNIITYWLRWESMYDMCKKACAMSVGTAANGYLDADMSFQVIDTGYPGDTTTPRLWLQTYQLTDVSSQVVFGTDLGTVRSFSYTENRPQGNVIYGGGPDFDPATLKTSQETGYRLYCEKDDNASIARYGDAPGSTPQAGRIEEFFDCSSVTTQTPTKAQIVAAMLQSTAAELKKQKYSATVELNLEPNDMADFGQLDTNSGDFRLGCKVAVQLPDLVLTDVIREVKADYSAEKGEVITPIVCDPLKFYSSQPTPLFSYQNRWQLADILRNWK